MRADYNRVMSTAFNGASNIVQGGGMACLDPQGLAEIEVRGRRGPFLPICPWASP